MIAYCRNQMSGFKTPKAVVFGTIPKTSTAKIQKFLLRYLVESAKAISAEESPNPSIASKANQCILAAAAL